METPARDRASFGRMVPLLESLLGLNRAERGAQLRELEASDPILHREIVALLALDSEPWSRDEPLLIARSRDRGFLFAPGMMVGRYCIEGAIGRGGQAEVYRAKDQRVGRTVALKVFTEGEGRASTSEMAEAEALAASRVGHPNICPVFEVLVADGVAAIAMPLLEGETLAARISRSGPLAPAEALRIVEATADALAATHAAGIVHGDIKPSNLWIDSTGHLLILDFGIARIATDPRVKNGLGSPLWMAPEQLSSPPAPPHPSIDVHAAGLVLHFLLRGVTPYESSTAEGTLAALRSGPLPDLSRGNPALPRRVVEVLELCLHRVPSERPTAAELKSELLAERRGEPPQLRRPTAWERMRSLLRRHPRASALCVGLVVAALFFTVSAAKIVADRPMLQRARAAQWASAIDARLDEIWQCVLLREDAMATLNPIDAGMISSLEFRHFFRVQPTQHIQLRLLSQERGPALSGPLSAAIPRHLQSAALALQHLLAAQAGELHRGPLAVQAARDALVMAPTSSLRWIGLLLVAAHSASDQEALNEALLLLSAVRAGTEFRRDRFCRLVLDGHQGIGLSPAHARFNRAKEALNAGDWQSAKEAISGLEGELDRFPAGDRFLTELSLAMGESATAGARAQRRLDADPRDFLARLHLSRALLARGELPEACLHARIAHGQIQSDAYARAHFAECLAALDQRDEAQAVLTDLVETRVSPDWAGLTFQARARAFEGIGWRDAALEAWGRAAEFRPKDPRVLLSFARALIRRGDPLQALTVLDQSLGRVQTSESLRAAISAARQACVDSLTRYCRDWQFLRRPGNVSPAALIEAAREARIEDLPRAFLLIKAAESVPNDGLVTPEQRVLASQVLLSIAPAFGDRAGLIRETGRVWLQDALDEEMAATEKNAELQRERLIRWQNIPVIRDHLAGRGAMAMAEVAAWSDLQDDFAQAEIATHE